MWMIFLIFEIVEEQEILVFFYFVYCDEIEIYMREIGVDFDWQFFNYVNGNQDFICVYGLEVVEFFKVIFQKYDLNGMF